jgi:phosphoenolpyruvate-protein phosphotransferase (PTS system enzyme I)
MGPAFPLAVPVDIAEQRVQLAARDGELARLHAALATTDGQLDRSAQRLRGEHSATGRDLIEVHRIMLRSPDLAGEAHRLIVDECLTAESAVARTMEHIRSVFLGLQDDFFRQRGGDFDVIGERLLRVLVGLPELRPGDQAPKGGVALGGNLSPLDLFPLSRAGVAAIVSESGGPTSHTAIVARAFGIPYVVGVDGLLGNVRAGALVIVDGTRGDVVIDPDGDTVRSYQMRMDGFRQRQRALHSPDSLPAVTTDGTRILLAANVESVAGIADAMSAGAEAIGLFRTEFLYLDRADLPSEEEQYADATAALRAARGVPVCFRALDLGGDKVPRVVKVPTGPNPALGIRSVRFLLQRPDVLRCQLRALYRAASLGPLRLMFPLVTGVTELARLQAVCKDVLASLDRERIIHNHDVPLGVMIETPSAAQTADHLAKRCDFLSVGTNDLMQYAFAADRENEDVAHLSQPLHPSVLRTLKQVAEMARAADTPISICGDMAGDPFLTWILLGLGFRDLSMDPDRIPLVRAVVRGSSLVEAQELTARALQLESEGETVDLVRNAIAGRFPDELDGFVPAAAGPS